MQRFIAATWGLAGVTVLLLWAIYRLASRGLVALSFSWDWYHWVVLTAVVLFMAYAEGYKGFQLAFSPRVAARARYLRRHADWLETMLAPLFLMCYFRAPRRRIIASVSLTVAIIGLILMVRLLPQPWRGIVDLGVVVGLSWGVASLWYFGWVAWFADDFPYSAELVEPST